MHSRTFQREVHNLIIIKTFHNLCKGKNHIPLPKTFPSKIYTSPFLSELSHKKQASMLDSNVSTQTCNHQKSEGKMWQAMCMN